LPKERDPVVLEIAKLFFNNWKSDGRFRYYAPSGAIYPCHTIGSTRVLCYLGYSKDERIKKTFKLKRPLKKWHLKKA